MACVTNKKTAAALALLEDLVEGGLDPGRTQLFVLDGSGAPRDAIGQVCLVLRYRNQRMRTVIDYLPKDLHDRVRAVLRTGSKLGATDGKAGIEQFAS